jgi:hypothetical protein
MKRLSAIEFCGLLLGIVFLAFGLFTIIWPQTGVVFHFTNDVLGMSPRSEPEVVTASGSRVYGVLSLLLGAGIVAASLYREKK